MNVYDKINNGDYKNKLPYPQNPKKPYLKKDATPAEIRAYADAVENYPVHEEAYKAMQKTYYEESRELENKFIADLEAEFDIVGHPKAGLLYSKAYERGHSGGFSEVLSYYEDLVELLK